MNVSFWAEADPQTLLRGLPADMVARAKDGQRVEVQIAPLGRRDPSFGDVKESIHFWDVSPKTIKRYRFRLRVRRRVRTEEAPFRLVLPVARAPRKTLMPFYEGHGFFMVDPRTLDPVLLRKA